MRRLLWALGWVSVAIWSLFCALAYGLLDIVGRLFMRNADSFSSSPETVESIFNFFRFLHNFSTGGVLIVWAIVSLLILAVPWTIDRLAGRAPPPGAPQGRFGGPMPRDGVIDLAPDQYSVGPRPGDAMPPQRPPQLPRA